MFLGLTLSTSKRPTRDESRHANFVDNIKSASGEKVENVPVSSFPGFVWVNLHVTEVFVFHFQDSCGLFFHDLCNRRRDGDVAQLVEHRTGTPPPQVRFPGAARDFSPRVNFQCTLVWRPYTPVRNRLHLHLCAR